jgi:hypothetical protein
VVCNTDHKRDKQGAIAELIQQVGQMFDDPPQAVKYLKEINGAKPRYIRDQIALIKQVIEKSDKQASNQAMDFCCLNNIFSAVDFKSVVERNTREKAKMAEPVTAKLNPLSGQMPSNIVLKPATSKITDYQILMQNQKQSNGKERINPKLL